MVTVALSLRFVLAVVFAGAGAAKLARLAAFELAVARYDLLPTRAIRPIARGATSRQVVYEVERVILA